MDFMLYEKINQWNQQSKETSSDDFTVLHRPWIDRGHGNDAQCPRECTEYVPDHGDIMEPMVVGRCNVHPSATQECP